MSLSAARNTREYSPDVKPKALKYPVKGSTHIQNGSLVGLLAGFLVPASANPAIKVLGCAVFEADNSAGVDGAISCEVYRGAFWWDNGTSGDAVAAVNRMQDCYAIDDHTVGLTDGGNGARPRAGKILDFSSTLGVLVESDGTSDASSNAEKILSFPIDLASITAGQVIGALVLPFSGKIKSTQFLVNKPATTGAKLATLQPRLTPSGGSAAAVTGGALALTSANCTPMGAIVAGSAVTAGNSFNAGDSLDVQGSAVTAFVEGNGTLIITIAAA